MVNLLIADRGEVSVVTKSYKVQSENVYLKIELREKKVLFYYSENGNDYIQVGGSFDATKISDEYCGTHFTGAFFGMHVEDMNKKEKWASFRYFKYEWYN